MAGSENSKALPVARRILLGGGAALTCARPAHACPLPAIWNPDAELLAAVEQALEADRRRCALWCQPETTDEEEAEIDQLMEVIEAAFDRACRLPAQTREGVLAKARLLRGELLTDEAGNLDNCYGIISPENIAFSLCADLLRGMA